MSKKTDSFLCLLLLFYGFHTCWNPSVSKSTHFDEYFTVLWSSNHLDELTGHMCLCVFMCVCEEVGGVNIKLSLCLVKYTSERLINQMTSRPIILVNQ